MKKVEDTNMADVVKTNQRRGIRPPSTITRPPSAVTVSRKSKSFNANDRIQVNIDRKDGGDVTVSSPLNFNMVSGGKASQSRINAPASVSCTTGWRSKSMNAKHSATTRLVPPKPHTMTFQTFKPERPLSSNASMTSQSSDSQSVVSRDERNIKMKAMNTAEARQHRHRPLSAGSKSDLRTTINNNSLSRNRNVTNKSSLTRQTSNKRTITSTSPVPVAKPAPTKLNSTKTVVKDPKPTQNGVKSTASVMSRLRKLGTTSPNNTSSTSASKNVVSSSATSLKKRADSCPPTSRLGTMIPNMTQQTKAPPKGHINEEKKTNVKTSSDTTTSGIKTSSKVKTSSVVKTSSTVKSSSGIKSVKSTIGKAFGGARQNDKKKPPSSSSTLTGLFNKSKKAGILKSEICPIIPMATEDNSNSSTLTSQQALTPHQTSSVINGSIGSFDSKKNDGITPPALNDILDDDGSSIKPISFTSCGGENNIRNTAIVTPFKGQFNLDHQTSTPKPSAMQKSQSSTSLGMRTSNKKDQLDDAANDAEARDVVVKGIANLRQNLEETMFSLRNTQLRHRGCDAFQRRISAQVDRAEFNEFRKSLPSDSTLSSNSNSIYRSHHNLMWGRTSVGHITCNALNSNKSKVKNYRESLDDEEQSAVKDQFSSLQRTRSVCCPRTAWHDVTDDGDLNESDELAEDMEKPRYVSSILKDHDLESEKWNHKIDRSDDTVNNSFETSSNVSTSIFEENTPQPSQYRRHHQELPIGKLGSRLSKSTMAIESSGKSVKFAKTKGFGKSERSIPGSSIVGSRLASNTVAYTPEHGGSLSFTTGLRENVFYQSLPRPNKSKLHDGTENNATNQSRAAGDGSHLPQTTAMTKVNNFKRSPSLQKLFGFGKSKQNPDVAMITSSSPVTVSTSYVVTSQPQSTRTWTNCQKFSSSSDLKATFTTSPSTYMSLPRTVPSSQTLATIATTTCSARPLSTMTTWSTSCNEPNNNYSVSPPTSNPFMDLNLLSSPSLYLDEESGKIAAESLVKQAAEFGKCDVSDWPLPTLYSSSKIARSIPNMAFNDSGATSFNLPAKETYHGSECDLSDQKRGFFTADNCSHSVMSSTTSLYSMKSNLENIREDSKSHNHHNRKMSMTSSMQSIPSTKMRFMQFTEEEKNKELQNMRNKFETLKRNPSPDGWSNGSSGVKNKASCGSLSSITSSIGSTEDGQRRRKKHWLKDSIKTAFSKRKSRPNLINEIEEEKTFDDTSSIENKEEADVVAHLKEELLMKERKLTDIRLEALTSQHQLHQMQDAMQKMKSEMETLRQENERLNRLGSSNINIASISSDVRRFTQQEKVNHMKNCDVRMKVVVEFPQHTVHDDTDERSHYHQILIGSCYVPRSSGWQQLDKKVQRAFEEYCQHMDPSLGLGLTPDSVVSFIVGDFIRFIQGETPDLLPCAYIIGDVDTIIIKLKDGNTGSVDSLALELLIDHDTVKRYTQLVLDHGRVMLCGPAGTGKSTLANRLAEHVVRMTLKRSGLGAIVKLDLKQRNEIEISEYLHQLSEDCSKPESCGREIPVVLILDGIHRSSLLQDAFTPLLATAAHSQLPYLIGVAGQNCLSGLELHQEFRWILCSNHTPPVSEFLERSLRKTMLSWQATHPCSDDDVLNDVIYWLPQCWRHINSFIEAYNSADVTLGPRLFTTCPMDEVTSKAWFTDLWNFSVVPYVISAVKQGCKSSMKQWRDPVEWIKQSWPWREPCDLLAIRPEDVCIDSAKSGNDITVATVRSQLNDPLLSMFLKLQETTATNCASNVPRDDINKVDTFERTLDRALGDLP